VIVLDTHAAIWLTTNDDSLGKKSRTIAASALRNEQLAVSAISFWEIGLLIARRRLKMLGSAAEIRLTILASGIGELPLNGDIAIRALDLEGLPGDPADRFIVASALVHEATLMTADAALLGWRHKLPRQDAAK